MAAVWGVEGAVEGSATGVAAASEVIEWRDAEVFEDVCGGHWAAVSHAVAAERIKVQLTPSPPTGFKFQKQFGDAQLREAGFGSRMSFAKCVEVICNTLKGVKSMTATLTENDSGGIDLIIDVTMEYFAAEYKLSLDKVAIGASDKLSAELRVTKQQLATARIELDQMVTTLRDATAESDMATQQLATATERIAKQLAEITSLKSELRKVETESESRIISMTATIEQMRAANEEFLAEIQTRDKRIEELEAVPKLAGGSADDGKKEDLGYIPCHFDPSKTSMEVSTDCKTVTHKTGYHKWQTVLCREVLSKGKQSFEVVIGEQHCVEVFWHLSVGVVKVGTMTSYDTHIGQTSDSWGYFSTQEKGIAYHKSILTDLPTPLRTGDVVRCQCDFDAHTISYFINGVSVGALFTGLDGPVNPVVSMYAPRAQITIR